MIHPPVTATPWTPPPTPGLPLGECYVMRFHNRYARNHDADAFHLEYTLDQVKARHWAGGYEVIARVTFAADGTALWEPFTPKDMRPKETV